MFVNKKIEVLDLPKVIIDQEACSGSGDCVALCSEVFEVVSGVSRIVEKYRDDELTIGKVPENLDCVYRAEEKCPFGAITVEE